MKKPTIYGTGNLTWKGSTNVSYYILEKSDDFILWLRKLFNEFGIIEEENEKLSISVNSLKRMVDVHERYEGETVRIDLFYGKKRVYMTLSGDPKEREGFGKKMLKIAKWVKIDPDAKRIGQRKRVVHHNGT